MIILTNIKDFPYIIRDGDGGKPQSECNRSILTVKTDVMLREPVTYLRQTYQSLKKLGSVYKSYAWICDRGGEASAG